MTREEAKHRLLDIERCTPIHTREDVRDFEALEMAIKALEKEPCDKCEVGNPCLYCKHEFEPQESEVSDADSD